MDWILRRLPAVAVTLLCVGCASRGNYELAWTIEAERVGGGGPSQVASSDVTDPPVDWGSRGRSVRVFDDAPPAAHDTLGFLYWRHTESPLVVKSQDADCETVSQPGSVVTTRLCASKVFVVDSRCTKGCRRDAVRAVADSLGADAIIIVDERTSFRGGTGDPSQLLESRAMNDGFRGTYVMIKMGSREE